jgi:hypothetical protein
MTESEWAACKDDPAAMLEHLGLSGWHTARKFRLFCCAAARRMPEPTSLNRMVLLRVAEADADGVADPAELARALAQIEEYIRPTNSRARRRRQGQFKAQPWRWNTGYATLLALNPAQGANEWRSAVHIAGLDTWSGTSQAPSAELSARVELVRCVFENPFHPASARIDPSRLGKTVAALARGIYDDREFNLLPILADALEDSGCHDEEMLSHCRSATTHVRGCWVVDLVLGLGVASPPNGALQRPAGA